MIYEIKRYIRKKDIAARIIVPIMLVLFHTINFIEKSYGFFVNVRRKE